MGLRALGLNPIEIANEAVNAPSETIRRRTVFEARRLYEDDGAGVLESDLYQIIGDRTRRERLAAFAFLSTCVNLFKRTVDDTTRPVYAVSPTRRTDPAAFEPNLKALYDEIGVNQKHEELITYADAMGACWLGFRYVPRLKSFVADITPTDCMTVIPDPEDPSREGAVIFDVPMTVGQGKSATQVKHRIYWDDEEMFRLDERGNVTPVRDGDGNATILLRKGNGHPGIIPGFMVHRHARAGRYWNNTSGRDRIAAQKANGFLIASALRLVKTQGHTAMTLNGDPSNFPKGQVLDAEQPLMAGENNTLSVLHNPTDPNHFLRVAEFITLGAGANYGLNRSLLNAMVQTDADMVALLERRKQVTKLASWVEQQTFRILKVLSHAHDDEEKRIPEAAKLKVDFAEHLSAKADRKAQLEIWETEVKRGVRSIYDIVRADNPEITSDAEAKEEITRNIESYAWLVEELRARNISLNADAGQPGQDARANGAMGSKVRDGEMTRDAADEASRTGKPDTAT